MKLLHIIKRLDCDEYWGGCGDWVHDPAFARKFISRADAESYIAGEKKIFICEGVISFDASLMDKAHEETHAEFMAKRALARMEANGQ